MIRVRNLQVRVPGFSLEEVDLTVSRGAFHALLGPTGSGKTLLLEALAGLAAVSRGTIQMDGRDLTRAAPEERGMGIVYQDCGLFPHLDVWKNVTYGLRYRGRDRGELNDWASWLLTRLGIERLKNRPVGNLSGGEKQRTALARALAVKPGVLLLDEPLSALDPCFRWDMQRLIKSLHEQLSLTCLMVTHDFAEALYLADFAAVIHQGRIQQTGPVREIFSCPATPLVAEFVGMRNLFPGDISGSQARVFEITLDLGRDCPAGPCTLALRPEELKLHPATSEPPAANAFKGEISEIHDRGAYWEIVVRANGLEWVAALSRHDSLALEPAPGRKVWVEIPPQHIHVM